MKKICTECNVEKELEDFTPEKSGRFGRKSKCRLCMRYKTRAYESSRYKTNPEFRKYKNKMSEGYKKKNPKAILEKQKRRYRKKREAVIERYGGECGCCKETKYEFLAIDHVNGGGNEERRNGVTSRSLVRKLFDNPSVLPEYRILCHNCNSSMGYYGYCPHQRENFTI